MPYINVQFNRQRLCETGKLPLVYCNAVFVNGVKHYGQHNVTNDSNPNAIGQRMDAVIYSMIVAIFYAGIILIILLTNAHRFRTNRRRKKWRNGTRLSNRLMRTTSKNKSSSDVEKQIIVFNDKSMTVVDSSDKYPETII